MNYDDELITEEESHNENVVNDEVVTRSKQGANKVYNILTAIIYPVLLALLLTALFFSKFKQVDTTSTIKYIACLVLYALSVFTILQTDVYVLVVPLPVITFYRVGCCETTKPLWLRIICGIASVILVIAPFLILFI